MQEIEGTYVRERNVEEEINGELAVKNIQSRSIEDLAGRGSGAGIRATVTGDARHHPPIHYIPSHSTALRLLTYHPLYYSRS